MSEQQTILVVDDDVLLSELMVHKLVDAGFQVVTASDGTSALDQLQSLTPSAVVLDGMMPGMDGFDVLKAIKQDPALATIPVLMLTARGLGKDVMTGLSLGAADYLVKPFMPDELVDRIRAVMDKD